MSEFDEEALATILDRLKEPVGTITLVEPDEGSHEAPVELVYSPAEAGGYDVELHDLQQYWPHQRRLKAAITLRDVPSFVQYCKDHQTPSAMFLANRERVTAVLDYGNADAPGWREHKATLELAATPEWNDWMGHQNQWLEQEDFADYLELHAVDIVEPEAAAVLETVLDIRLHKAVEYSKATSLRDGTVQLEYRETITERGQDQTRQGDSSIPQRLKLALRRYQGGGFEPVEVEALIRYRLRDGHLDLKWVFPSSVARQADDDWRHSVEVVSAQLNAPILWGNL